MLSAISHAGKSLRELNVPKASIKILLFITERCPNLEKLTFDEDYETTPEIYHIPLLLKLRALSIHSPSRLTLRYLVPPSEELRLIGVPEAFIADMTDILRSPPRKLHLHIECPENTLSPASLALLYEACPRIEELSVKVLDPEIRPSEFRLLGIMKLLSTTSRNAESHCKNMTLEGKGVMKLLEQARPNASVCITISRQTVFKFHGYHYVPTVLLTKEYLNQSVWKSIKKTLKVISIPWNVDKSWKGIISGMQFERVSVKTPGTCEGFCISAKVVETSLHWLSDTEWKWLHDVEEVWIVGSRHWRRIGDVMEFLKGLARLLKRFGGTHVFIQNPIEFDLRQPSMPLRIQAFKAIDALGAFEGRGGRAPTVRRMLDILLPLTTV